MEIIHKKKSRNCGGRFFKVNIILFLFLLGFIRPVVSQEDADATKDSMAVAAESSEGPSLDNLSKSLSAQTKEIAELKAKERHNEIMSYIYMGLGFSVVIAIAWFTTTLARKRKKKDEEQRAIRLQHMKHKPHHPRR